MPSRESPRPPVPRVCEHCGATFAAKQSQIDRGFARFCSRACRYAADRTREMRTCETCGAAFSVSPANAARRASRWCSHACQALARREGEVRVCRICGTPYYAEPNRIRRGQALHCSATCANAARRLASGRGRGSYLYVQWRNAVLTRDGHTCQNCGATGDVRLHAHHIQPWAHAPELRFDVANGVTVCESCHANIHPQLWYFTRHHAPEDDTVYTA